METKTFEITIAAPRQKVWGTLWNDAAYRQWTAAFTEGSRAETDWQEGSKVLFLDDNNDGMSSVIAKKITNAYMSFRHMGEVLKGVEKLDDPAHDAWRGAHENYILEDAAGDTRLTVELEVEGMPEDMLNYFMATWPKALDALKVLAEKA